MAVKPMEKPDVPELPEAITEALPDNAFWIGLGGAALTVTVVTLFDIYSPQTISEGVRNFNKEHPVVGNFLTASVCGALAIHLLTEADKDPIQRGVMRVVDMVRGE